jgi:hypothetical protein
MTESMAPMLRPSTILLGIGALVAGAIGGYRSERVRATSAS